MVLTRPSSTRWSLDDGCNSPSRPARRCRRVGPRQLQAHFAAGQGGEQRQVVTVSEVSDAEHAPFDLPRPVPRDIQALVDQPSASASTPVGTLTPVRTGEYTFGTFGSAHWIGRPHAVTAARTPCPQRSRRANTSSSPSARNHAQAVQQVGVGRVGPLIVPLFSTLWPPLDLSCASVAEPQGWRGPSRSSTTSLAPELGQRYRYSRQGRTHSKMQHRTAQTPRP